MEFKFYFSILIILNATPDVFLLRNGARNENIHHLQVNKSKPYFTPHRDLHDLTSSDDDGLTIEDNEQKFPTVKPQAEQPNKLFTEQFENEDGKDNIIKRIINQNDQEFNYEVTENVVDVKNNETLAKPVINFALVKPLNLATISVSNTTNNFNNNTHDTNVINGGSNHGHEDANITLSANPSNINNEAVKALRKNYVSIFHIKAEFDSKHDTQDSSKPLVNINQAVNIHKPYQPFKDYLRGIKQGIASGFQSILHKDKHTEVHPGVTGLLINKLRKTSSAAVDKVHKAIFGHQFRLENFDD